MDECRHGLLPDECSTCKHPNPITRSDPCAFDAKYAGWCRECRERFEPGDRIRYVDDLLVHEDC